MIDHRNPDKRPFKVGQLVQYTFAWHGDGLFLVLELEYDSDIESWLCVVLSQKTGAKEWLWSHSAKPAEKTDG